MGILTRREQTALIVFFILGVAYAIWHIHVRSVEKVDLGSDIPSNLKVIVVQVEGAVVNPGPVTVLENSTVGDAIEAAGGFRPDADDGSVDTTSKVTSGQKIIVPYRDEEKSDNKTGSDYSPDDQSKPDSHRSSRLININYASMKELAAIPGIGEELAARIVKYRLAHGRFKKIEEIMNVDGIGEKKFRQIKGYITVGD